ncbi:hypothetical protein AUJ65_03285 [Candidatus Micrarchaeota archaeon CG1_02_51_15]|nr:MAG: hypothetical protein AUJ65_03285 [Candidatus Micrarchaeota archaeon CG1_02_51_15]
MKNVFSAKRQASKKKRMPSARQYCKSSQILAMLAGWPPLVLFVSVKKTSFTLPGSCSTSSFSRPSSKLPSNGFSAAFPASNS